jgi:hypothetical protein
VQDQYKHRTHYEDNRDPEFKQRLKDQVKGYASTIKATEAERRPPQADPFSQLFSEEFQHEKIDRTYIIPKTSQDDRDRNNNDIAGWVQAVKRAGHQVTNIPLTKKPREHVTDHFRYRSKEFPNSKLSGCWFYFTQVLSRKSIRIFSQSKVFEDYELKNWLAHFSTLALTPINRIPEALGNYWSRFDILY